jgi:CelD/BcsL family acetyltransferase involved in cellulose biosynthesis
VAASRAAAEPAVVRSREVARGRARVVVAISVHLRGEARLAAPAARDMSSANVAATKARRRQRRLHARLVAGAPITFDARVPRRGADCDARAGVGW